MQASGRPGSRRGRVPRAALFVAAVLLVAAAALLLLRLQDGGLVAPRPRLDRLVPADVAAAVRIDGPDAAGSPALRWLGESQGAEPLRDALSWDAVVDALRRAEASFSRATGGALTLAADVVPAEAVVAVRGGGVLAMSRISARARFGDALLRPDAAALAAQGIDADPDTAGLLRVRGAGLWIARTDDVLLAATDRSLAADALSLAGSKGRSLADRPGFDDALALGGPAGGRVLFWADATALGERLRATGDGMRESSVWFGLWESEDGTVRGSADLRAAAIDAELRVSGAPSALRTLRRSGVPDATVTAALAAPYVVPGETYAWGGLPLSSADAVLLLLRSLPPEHLRVAEEELAKSGETLAGAARRIAAPLADGVGFAVARLAEASGADGGVDGGVDDGGEPGSVRRIPATTIVFAVRPGRRGEEALDVAKSLGASLAGVEAAGTDASPRGAAIHVVDRGSFLGQWDLLRPAALVTADRVVFTTHEDHLRRSFRARRPAVAVAGDAGLHLATAPLVRQVEDEGWNHAQSVCVHDWGAERRAFEASVLAAGPVSPAALADRADAEIRNRMRIRRERELPLAWESWRERWQWLKALGDARIELTLTPEPTWRIRAALMK